MELGDVTGEGPKTEPKLVMHKLGDLLAPKAPVDLNAIGSEKNTLVELAVKLAGTVARFNTEWVAKELHLSLPLVRMLRERLSHEGLIEELWQTGAGSSHYRIAEQGKNLAVRLMEACAYVGPAPVTLDAYSEMLKWQFANAPVVKPEHVLNALSQMVIPKKSAQLAGLAVSSGRSLFVYGPSGNGKSTLGRSIQTAMQGDYWIPYAIDVGASVIRVFDDHCHETVDLGNVKTDTIDHRWVRIRRPLVIVGGELTLDMLDVIYSPAFKFYEAPPHLKANGGVFLVDDFGRERVSPEQLLNRFITPMEYQIDYFTLRTGQKIQMPLKHVLIIATNLSPETVTDPAFLRRMGYRLFLGSPTPDQYTQIFNAYAQRVGATVAPEAIERLLERYKTQNRELRACEPRDLVERSRDICTFHNRPLELTNKVLDLAWTGYFVEQLGPSKAEPDLLVSAPRVPRPGEAMAESEG